MRPLRLMLIGVALALAALLAVGISQLGGSTASSGTAITPAQARAALAGSPPRLRALHEQAGQLIAGGLAALRSRLAQLRGLPVVINKWASWCAPCRAEFAAFQAVSVREGRRVAFIGI